MSTRFICSALCLIALAAMPALAEKGAKAPLLSSDLPKVGVGIYGNLGIGSPGLSAVPGISAIADDLQAGIHFGQSEGMYQLAGDLDLLFINQSLKGLPLSFFAGPGALRCHRQRPGGQHGAGLRAARGLRSPHDSARDA